MTTPPQQLDYGEYRKEDAEDRRCAANLAGQLVSELDSWEDRAERIYKWLRERPTVAPHSLSITPGTPQPQPTQEG